MERRPYRPQTRADQICIIRVYAVISTENVIEERPMSQTLLLRARDPAGFSI